MQEHAVELLSIIGVFVSLLFGAVIWFVKRDRKAIDLDIEKLRDEISGVKECLEREVGKAMAKVNQVEHNYITRLDALKDGQTAIQLEVARGFGELKAMLAREYMSKEEAERAYNHIKAMKDNIKTQ